MYERVDHAQEQFFALVVERWLEVDFGPLGRGISLHARKIVATESGRGGCVVLRGIAIGERGEFPRG